MARAKKQQENSKKTTKKFLDVLLFVFFCVLYSGGFVWPFQNVSSSGLTVCRGSRWPPVNCRLRQGHITYNFEG